jgi:hypothetical protein
MENLWKIQCIYIKIRIIMKKPILNEEIARLRKIMGLNEGFDLSSVDNPNAYTDDIINHNLERGGEDMDDFSFEKSAIESASGEKVVQREFDDYDRPLFYSVKDDNIHYFIGDFGNGEVIVKYNAKTGERYPIGDLKDYNAPERAKDSEDNELFEGGRSDKHDDSHGSPYDRGYADAYYGRGKDPHKYPEGTYNGERVTDLSPEELDAYHSGYDGCTDSKDWGEMEEGDGPEEKMVSFDDLLAQDTDGMSPEDQAMIDAHDEEEANKYASKNYDDVESGAIDEDWGSSDQGYMNKAIHDDLNQPTEFNFGMYDDLKNAAEEAVDHFWDDWEEYNTNREGLVMKAMKLYLRRYFPDWYENMSKMFA